MDSRSKFVLIFIFSSFLVISYLIVLNIKIYKSLHVAWLTLNILIACVIGLLEYFKLYRSPGRLAGVNYHIITFLLCEIGVASSVWLFLKVYNSGRHESTILPDVIWCIGVSSYMLMNTCIHLIFIYHTIRGTQERQFNWTVTIRILVYGSCYTLIMVSIFLLSYTKYDKLFFLQASLMAVCVFCRGALSFGKESRIKHWLINWFLYVFIEHGDTIMITTFLLALIMAMFPGIFKEEDVYFEPHLTIILIVYIFSGARDIWLKGKIDPIDIPVAVHDQMIDIREMAIAA